MPIRRGDLLVHKRHHYRTTAGTDEADGQVLVSHKGVTAQAAAEDFRVAADFEFVVFSRRWGHDDTYRLRPTPTGWHVSHLAINGDGDPSGDPFLFRNLAQDDVRHPGDLGDQLAQVWRTATAGSHTPAQIQGLLDAVAAQVRRLNGGR